MTYETTPRSLAILGSNEKASCRKCKHFQRVNEGGGIKIIHRRGFCSLGMLNGDYSLYMSSSEVHNCPAYVIDWFNSQTHEVEHELCLEFWESADKIGDGRTTVARTIKKLDSDLAETIRKCEEGSKRGDLLSFFSLKGEINKALFSYFLKAHWGTIGELNKRTFLKERDYHAVIAAIQTIIDDHCQDMRPIDIGDMTIEIGEDMR